MRCSIPVSARGVAEWAVLDEHGRVEQSGRHQNLITNTGLTALLTDTKDQGNYSYNYSPMWGRSRVTLRLGTGSAAPDPTDTALTNEVIATQGDTKQKSTTAAWVEADGVFRLTSVQTKYVDFANAYNLTEWGFAYNDTDDLSFRDLFRDEVGDPVTVSILAGKQLRFIHTLYIDLPTTLSVQSVDINYYDISDTLVDTDTFDCDVAYFRHASASLTVLFQEFDNLTAGVNLRDWSGWTPPAPPVYDAANYLSSSFISGGGTRTVSYPAFNTRRQMYLMGAAEAHDPVYGFGWYRQPYGNHCLGLLVCFHTGSTFTKANTHTLEYGYEVTLNRA